MSGKPTGHQPESGGAPAESEKKAYERPAILSRERFEALAALCSPPSKSNPGDCPSGIIQS